ncbi:hypothetical protein PR048_022729 [Dryococelus australis]|uniref:Uncharacterized protein n=1 Tax=Dryococelus australis TaxID=614101 RepID=A0ABQ9GS12_9NEOP|nr:hypothetical protein PR048_022729 [Dryococelus australis]
MHPVRVINELTEWHAPSKVINELTEWHAPSKVINELTEWHAPSKVINELTEWHAPSKVINELTEWHAPSKVINELTEWHAPTRSLETVQVALVSGGGGMGHGKPRGAEVRMSGPGIDPGSSRMRFPCVTTAPPRSARQWRNTIELVATVAKRLACSPPTKANRVTLGFSQVGIVPDDAVGWRIFYGNIPHPPPFHSCAAPYSPQWYKLPEREIKEREREKERHERNFSSRRKKNIVSLERAYVRGEFWVALYYVLRADEGEVRWIWRSAKMQRRGKREIPEKTCVPAASSGTISACENSLATTEPRSQIRHQREKLRRAKEIRAQTKSPPLTAKMEGAHKYNDVGPNRALQEYLFEIVTDFFTTLRTYFPTAYWSSQELCKGNLLSNGVLVVSGTLQRELTFQRCTGRLRNSAKGTYFPTAYWSGTLQRELTFQRRTGRLRNSAKGTYFPTAYWSSQELCKGNLLSNGVLVRNSAKGTYFPTAYWSSQELCKGNLLSNGVLVVSGTLQRELTFQRRTGRLRNSARPLTCTDREGIQLFRSQERPEGGKYWERYEEYHMWFHYIPFTAVFFYENWWYGEGAGGVARWLGRTLAAMLDPGLPHDRMLVASMPPALALGPPAQQPSNHGHGAAISRERLKPIINDMFSTRMRQSANNLCNNPPPPPSRPSSLTSSPGVLQRQRQGRAAPLTNH